MTDAVIESEAKQSMSSSGMDDCLVAPPRNDGAKQKAGIAPGLRIISWYVAQFADARFGGVAGHDLISVS